MFSDFKELSKVFICLRVSVVKDEFVGKNITFWLIFEQDNNEYLENNNILILCIKENLDIIRTTIKNHN